MQQGSIRCPVVVYMGETMKRFVIAAWMSALVLTGCHNASGDSSSQESSQAETTAAAAEERTTAAEQNTTSQTTAPDSRQSSTETAHSESTRSTKGETPEMTQEEISQTDASAVITDISKQIDEPIELPVISID